MSIFNVDLPPEVPAWQHDIEYHPACALCRDAAGKERAGVLDEHLCVGHLASERKRLDERVKALEKENSALSELFDAAGQDNNILHEKIKELKAELARCREMYKRDA